MALPDNPLVYGLLFILCSLTIYFIVRFLVPAVRLQSSLARLLKQIRAIKEPELTIIDNAFSGAGDLKNVWAEYRATLHQQTELNSSTGTFETISLRSTLPAEYVFTPESVIDSRLGTEFFKHLPGVLTGIGIIGTFVGLINGLAAFQISQNPLAVADSLNHLMGAVQHAFLVSASAIACAVLITFIEKLCVTSLSSKLNALCLKIDSFFRAGTGEEYLSRIARSSESAEKEARILKDALVSDLEIILDRVTAKQIAESQTHAADLRQNLVDGLNESLAGPMTAISEVAQRLGGSQVDAVNNLLTDTLAQFSAQIRDMFGSQMSGASDMQQQATLALQKILAEMGGMADRLSLASENASATIAQQVTDALGAIEHQQRSMIDLIRDAIESMRSDVAASTQSSNSKVVATVDELGTQVAALIGTLQQQVESASVKDEARLQAMATHFASVQSDMGSSVASAFEQLAGMKEKLSGTIDAFRSVTGTSFDKLVLAANSVESAATRFAEAGSKTADVLSRSTQLVSELGQASRTLSGASESMNSVLTDYKSVREQVARLVGELASLVESAKRDAGLSESLVAKLEAASAKLGAATTDADEYLAQVSKVLAQTFSEFSTQVEQSLRAGNREFQQELTNATRLLKQQIEDLGEVLEAIPSLNTA